MEKRNTETIAVKCPLCGVHIGSDTPEGLARARKLHNKVRHLSTESASRLVASGICPECGATLFSQEGCIICQSCGYSKCS